MRKLWIPLLVCAFALSGCSSSADTLASPSPAATTSQPSVMTSPEADVGASPSPGTPSVSQSPGAEGGDMAVGGAGGITSLDEAKRASEQVADAVEKLTEIADAEAVAVGTLAVVAVQYDGQYKGGMDDRIRKMILARAQTVDSDISSVAVTDDSTLYRSVESLADALQSATSLNEVTTQAEALADKMDVYKE